MQFVFLPHDAMHSANYVVAARCPSARRPSVCPSHAGILSKRLNISDFISCGNIQTASPLTGPSN